MSTQGVIEVTADAEVPASTARRVAEILQHEQVGRIIHGVPLHRVSIEALLPAGMTLLAAHRHWTSLEDSVVKTMPPLPAQPLDAVLPEGIVRVGYSFVTEPSGGMSSHYGFKGHFASLLISVPEGSVWDARIDEAK